MTSTTANPFAKATKYAAKLRMNLSGPSGSGKTYSALAMGTALGKTALVDTEHGSASKYADIFEFDTLNLDPPYHPDRYIEAIHAAESAGYDVVVLDSLSHAWFGTGGLLEVVDAISARSRNPNSFAAWKDATPIQNRLVEAILTSKIHIIATTRSKQDYIIETKDGKQVPRKVGMAPVQREGIEYEFDVFAELDMDNNLLVQKSRCPALSGQVYRKPGADVARILGEWLSGATPQPQIPAPAPESHHSAPEAENKGAALATLIELAKAVYGLDFAAEMRTLMRDMAGVESSKDLTEVDIASLTALLNAMLGERAEQAMLV